VNGNTPFILLGISIRGERVEPQTGLFTSALSDKVRITEILFYVVGVKQVFSALPTFGRSRCCPGKM
jgi:hypothetical protein